MRIFECLATMVWSDPTNLLFISSAIKISKLSKRIVDVLSPNVALSWGIHGSRIMNGVI